MQTVVHVTHEAIQKIGGIGAVLQGLLTSKVYLEQAPRNILVGPFWPGDERGALIASAVVQARDLVNTPAVQAPQVIQASAEPRVDPQRASAIADLYAALSKLERNDDAMKVARERLARMPKDDDAVRAEAPVMDIPLQHAKRSARGRRRGASRSRPCRAGPRRSRAGSPRAPA